MREFKRALDELHIFERRVIDLGSTLKIVADETESMFTDPKDPFTLGFEAGQTQLAQRLLRKYSTLFPQGVKK